MTRGLRALLISVHVDTIMQVSRFVDSDLLVEAQVDAIMAGAL